MIDPSKTAEPNEPTYLIRLPEVMRRTSLGRSQIYRLAKSGDFPQQIKLGFRAAAWNAAEVDEWIERRIAASRGRAA